MYVRNECIPLNVLTGEWSPYAGADLNLARSVMEMSFLGGVEGLKTAASYWIVIRQIDSIFNLDLFVDTNIKN